MNEKGIEDLSDREYSGCSGYDRVAVCPGRGIIGYGMGLCDYSWCCPVCLLPDILWKSEQAVWRDGEAFRDDE